MLKLVNYFTRLGDVNVIWFSDPTHWASARERY